MNKQYVPISLNHTAGKHNRSIYTLNNHNTIANESDR